MPFNPQSGDAVDALAFQQLLAAFQRSAWDGGCQVMVGTSSTSVDVDVAAGDVYLSGTPTSVSAGTVTLADGHVDHPRKDVVYVDANGDLAVATGDPALATPGLTEVTAGDGTVRYDNTYRPAPYDLNDVFPSASVLAVVWVPSIAARSSDLTADMIDDRRVPYVESTGITQSEGDARYVQESGDTMDGTLVADALENEGGESYATGSDVTSATVDAADHVKDARAGDDLDFVVGAADPGAPDSGVRVWFDTS